LDFAATAGGGGVVVITIVLPFAPMAGVAISDLVSYIPPGDIGEKLIAAVVGEIGGCGSNEDPGLRFAVLYDSEISST